MLCLGRSRSDGHHVVRPLKGRAPSRAAPCNVPERQKGTLCARYTLPLTTIPKPWSGARSSRRPLLTAEGGQFTPPSTQHTRRRTAGRQFRPAQLAGPIHNAFNRHKRCPARQAELASDQPQRKLRVAGVVHLDSFDFRTPPAPLVVSDREDRPQEVASSDEAAAEASPVPANPQPRSLASFTFALCHGCPWRRHRSLAGPRQSRHGRRATRMAGGA